MNYTDFMYALGDGILWTTDIIFDHIGNIFNYAAVALIIGGMAYWINLMGKYKNKAKTEKGYRE